MVGIVFMDLFDTKVIYYKGECDGVSDMSPQAGRVGNFKISVWGEVFLEGRVREFSGLWQAVDGLSYFGVDIAVL